MKKQRGRDQRITEMIVEERVVRAKSFCSRPKTLEVVLLTIYISTHTGRKLALIDQSKMRKSICDHLIH